MRLRISSSQSRIGWKIPASGIKPAVQSGVSAGTSLIPPTSARSSIASAASSASSLLSTFKSSNARSCLLAFFCSLARFLAAFACLLAALAALFEFCASACALDAWMFALAFARAWAIIPDIFEPKMKSINPATRSKMPARTLTTPMKAGRTTLPKAAIKPEATTFKFSIDAWN